MRLKYISRQYIVILRFEVFNEVNNGVGEGKKSKAGVCYKLIRFVGSFYALIKQYLFISSHAMRIEIMKSDSR